jgi:hypothetical protein
MTRLITIVVYDMTEIRAELAKRTDKFDDYSRQEIARLIKQYLPMVEKTGGRYFLTESELSELANMVQSNKRPKKY